MRFYRAMDAYYWYRTKRSQIDRARIKPHSLYRAEGFENAVIALVDIERMLERLSRRERRALSSNTPDFPEACGRFEQMLRGEGYLLN